MPEVIPCMFAVPCVFQCFTFQTFYWQVTVIPTNSFHEQVQCTSSPPKILPVKPKVYLLANFILPASSCVDLSLSMP